MTRDQQISSLLKLIANYGYHAVVKRGKVYLRGRAENITSVSHFLKIIEHN